MDDHLGRILPPMINAKMSIVDETLQLVNDWKSKADPWRAKVRENQMFRFGEQWSQEQKDQAASRGLLTAVVNRIHPAVESGKAMMTAHRPSFRVAPREDSDNKIAHILSGLLAFIFDKSNGIMHTRQAIDDYYTAAIGYLVIDYDATQDMGKGEVTLSTEDPLDVIVDPTSKNRLFDDANDIFVVKRVTKSVANAIFKKQGKKVKEASGDSFTQDPGADVVSTTGDVFFQEHIGDVSDEEYVQLIDRYTKKNIVECEIFESFSGLEKRMNLKEYEEYKKEEVWAVGQNIFENEKEAEQAAQAENQAMQQQYLDQADQAVVQGLRIDDVPKPEPVQPVPYTKGQLVDGGIIQKLQFNVAKPYKYRILGHTLMKTEELPGYHFPIVPIISNHNRTPYPTSDVALAKGLQQYINKVKAITIAHSQASTNLKVLLPEGSVDMDDFEEKWGRPSVGIQVDFSEGSPVVAQPTPLSNELFAGEATAKNDISHLLGLYELSMGNASNAPDTHKATIAIDEFGQRAIRSKLLDVEIGLTRIATVALAYIQKYYTTEKIFRVMQPNNSMSEYVVNKRLVDDKTKEIQIINNITIGAYDVVAVAGSTLPTNRYAELEIHTDAYEKGIIDQVEVLKKTEVYDMEGVLQRTDKVGQLEAALGESQEKVKELEGDLQTRDRESVNLKKRVEVEKFKADLDMIKNRMQASESLFGDRLNDILSQIKSLSSDTKKDKERE